MKKAKNFSAQDIGEKKSFFENLKNVNEFVRQKTTEYKIFRLLLPLIVYFLFFLVFEAIFAFIKFYVDNGFTDCLYLVNVSLSAILCLTALLWLLPRKAQAVLFPVSAVLWTVYGLAQICVCKSTGNMFRLKNIATAKNAVRFADGALKKVPVSVWVAFGVMLAAVVAADILILKISDFKMQKKVAITKTAFAVAVFAGCLLSVLLFSPDSEDSELTYHKYIYDNFTDAESVYEMSDFYTYFVQDIKSTVLTKATVKKNVGKIDDFFAEKGEHSDNDMTGIFEGKNLLAIQLESFETYLIDEGICPNLKKVMSESIVFENYYGMYFGSEPTFGNEMAVNTGLYATSDYVASNDIIGYDFSYSLANMFRNQGYSANVYHQNDGDFYNRAESELSFGYEKYNSFRDMTDEDVVYEDDLVMADCDDLYNQIVSGDNFMNCFLTYSAHMMSIYYLDEDERYETAIARHPELADKELNTDLDLYDIEAVLTDDMVGRLLERMEEDGSLDNTVILFYADHANISDLQGTSGEEYFESQNIPCFIYSKDIEPQTVEKICTNIDLLPTVLNLFGIENPGTYIGNDIFDEEAEGIAYLPSFDWKTDKCLYVDGKVAENYTDGEISEEYIEKINERVKNRIEVNNLLIYTGYSKIMKKRE